MDRSSVKDSHTDFDGGGLAVQDAASAVLLDSALTDCTGGYGGGVVLEYGANVTLQGSRIERCVAYDSGGGVSAYDKCQVELLDGSSVSGCHANKYTGGLRLRSVAIVLPLAPLATAGEPSIGV